MKNKVLAIILLLIALANNTKAQNDTIKRASFKIEKKRPLNSWQSMYLKGRVKSVLQAEVEKESSKPDTAKYSNYTYYFFDTNGLLTKMINSTVCDPCPRYRRVQMSFYNYDPLGFIRNGVDFFNCLGGGDTINYVWGDNSLVEYLSDGSGRRYKRASYKYDERGRAVEYEIYNENGKVAVKHLLKETNNIVTEQIITNGQTKNTYDTNGVLMQTNQGVTVYTYKYKYDKSGNWIVQKEYMGGKEGKITKREITYY